MKYFGLALVFTALIAAAIADSTTKKHNSTATIAHKTSTTAFPNHTPTAWKKTSESIRQSRCYSTQFQCANGQCISRGLLCDGRKDCRDGSDEAFSVCFSPGGRQTTTTQRYGGIGDRGEFSCASDEFVCSTGECISQLNICNGRNDCRDGSDEEASICPSGNHAEDNNARQCLGTEFKCGSGECIFGGYRCDGTAHCSDRSDEDWSLCQTYVEERPATSETPVITSRPDQQGNGGNSGNSWDRILTPCDVPPQPRNGHWRLHRSLCESNIECSAPLNVRTMDPGSYLVYSCDQGYILNGTSDVLCGPGGQWIHTPKCDQVKCPDLSSSATEALCTWNNVAVSCEVPAPIGTTADLKCRQGFVQEVMYEQAFKNVKCQPDGKWSPNPIKCVKKPRKVKLVLEGDMILGD